MKMVLLEVESTEVDGRIQNRSTHDGQMYGQVSVCWEQCSCNIQVTVAALFLLLLLSPLALCL